MTHHLKLTIGHERITHTFTRDAEVGAWCRLICTCGESVTRGQE